MGEAQLVHWLVTVILPVVLTGATFYISAQNKASQLERRLTTLEVINSEQEKTIASHMRRLDKHEEEQKTTLKLVERIDFMNESIKELKGDIVDIKSSLEKL